MPKIIHQGFNILAPEPADSRTMVALFTDLALLPVKYDRMETYVIGEDLTYRYYRGQTPEWRVVVNGSGGGGTWGTITGNLNDQIDLINRFNNYSLTSHTHSTVPEHTHPTADIEDVDGQVLWNRPLVAPNFIIIGSSGSTGGGGVPGDIEAPVMGVVTEDVVGDNSVSFTWTAATDNIGVTAYMIYQNGTLIDTVDDLILSYEVTGLLSSTTYTFGVRAVDASNNMSPISNLVSTTTGIAMATLSNLTYAGWSTLTKIGDSITNPVFSWGVAGVPTNLRLSDNAGVLTNQVVSGSSYNSSVVYTPTVYGSINWTLLGDNTNTITKSTLAVFATYSGKNTTGVVPNAATILAGTSYTILTNGSVSINNPTTDSEYLWIAIPDDVSQTGVAPTQWFIEAPFNFGSIDPFGFISNKGLVAVNGKNYHVFMYNYPSAVSLPIILNK